jgi:hypothetical protein
MAKQIGLGRAREAVVSTSAPEVMAPLVPEVITPPRRGVAANHDRQPRSSSNSATHAAGTEAIDRQRHMAQRLQPVETIVTE